MAMLTRKKKRRGRKRLKKIEISSAEIDLTYIKTLKKFLSGEGDKSCRILPRYVTGLPARRQKEITKAIKRARALNML